MYGTADKKVPWRAGGPRRGDGAPALCADLAEFRRKPGQLAQNRDN